MRTISVILLYCVYVCSCSAINGGADMKPAPAPSNEGNSSKSETKEFGEWQRITASISGPEAGEPIPEIVGFDRVSAIFDQKKYGPCSLCHNNQWPHIGDRGWSGFLDSVTQYRSGAKTTEELAALLIACVDPISEARCAGDPLDPSDNLEYKMPSKYGFESVNDEDLALLRRWQSGGLKSVSVQEMKMLRMSDLHHFDFTDSEVVNAQIRFGSILVNRNHMETSITFEARPTNPCEAVELNIIFQNIEGSTLTEWPVKLRCASEQFESEIMVTIGR